MTNTFSTTTSLTKTSDTTYNLAISDAWNVGSIPNGGYLMAYAAKAMAENSPHPHPLVVTAYYLDKSDVGGAEMHNSLLRNGKSMSTLSGSLMQADPKNPDSELSERIRLTASFTEFNFASGDSYYEEPAPTLSAFEDCIPIAEAAPHLAIYDQFTMRMDPACVGWWKERKYLERSEMNFWVEYKDKSPFDVFGLLMMPDMLPPAIFCRVGPSAWVPTLEMTVNIRALPKTSRIQIRTRNRTLTNNVLEEDVEIWDEHGNLLAISRQIAKIRIIKKDPSK